MAPYCGEVIGVSSMSPCVIIDCLLPNSIIVPLTCQREITLSKLKGEIWREAKKYPLYGILGAAEQYVLVGVTADAEQEVFWDEQRRLCDLRLFSPILKLVQPRGNTHDHAINHEISLAIGRSVLDLDEAKDEELQEFRQNVLDVVKESVRSRQQHGMESLSRYQHPAQLEPSIKLPDSVHRHLDEGYLTVTVWRGESESTSVRIRWDSVPAHIIEEAFARLPPAPLAQDLLGTSASIGASSYALKICGTKEYLLSSQPITQYKTVRLWVARGKTPQLSLVSRGELYASLTTFDFLEPSYKKHHEYHNSGGDSISLWHPSMEGRLKIHIFSASNLSIKDASLVSVLCGIFHGGVLLCEVKESQSVPPAGELSWGEWLQFDLNIQEIPRGAKLCFALCAERKQKDRKSKKENDDQYMVLWGNVNAFDHCNQLVHGKKAVVLLTPPKNCQDFFNPLGTAGTRVNNDSAFLEIGFEERFSKPVTFPDTQQLEDYARYILKLEKKNTKQDEHESCIAKSIQKIAEKDPLSELSEEEKELLWNNRHHCISVPDSLPRLLDSVNWGSRDQVSQLYLLLKEWPILSLETALELLQCKYADPSVRSHAVRSLGEALPDEALIQYMLQLVQTLKHEQYLDSSLLRLLLRKALTNAKIGHSFFWQVRSDIHNWPESQRILCVLEAYCRGLGPNLKALIRQVEMLDGLARLADDIKEHSDSHKEKTRYLKEKLVEVEISSLLQNVCSPLHLGHSLGRLRPSECRVLDSGRRPLCLVWDNADKMAPHYSLSHSIIFKNGDDLRQDMLTLQVINIMGQIWIKEDLDLRMMPYMCMATGKHMGVIEVVRNARTVHSIQRRSRLGTIQVDSSQLYKWIRDKNKGLRLEAAIDNFTRSCAGYCVATFVLGIGDRHPDNIMVNEEGQIFHIDFGHFLGNFKKKCGIKRERVPFVLTQDFLRVIAGGAENPKDSLEFQRFQVLCGKAYLALRKHCRLFMNLFTSLLSTGMPELQSVEDICYLRKTLAVDATEEEALLYFQNQFCEAYGGAWTTKLDWFFHSVKHR